MASKYVEWEGSVYRLNDEPFKIEEFMNGKWIPVINSLFSTIEHEGMRVTNPELTPGIRPLSLSKASTDLRTRSKY